MLKQNFYRLVDMFLYSPDKIQKAIAVVMMMMNQIRMTLVLE
jgi:hypothetical protein